MRAFIVATAIGSANFAAAEPVPYYSAGAEYLMERSTTELAIELLDGDDLNSAEVCFRQLGLGEVAPLSWGGPTCRFALLRVPSADAETAARVAEWGPVASVHSVYRFSPDGLPHLGTGRIVVKLADGVTNEDRHSLLERVGAFELGEVPGVKRAYLVTPLPAAQMVTPLTPHHSPLTSRPAAAVDGDEAALAANLHHDPRVEFAQPDLISPLRLAQVDPGDEFTPDPLFAEQWHLQNTGQGGGVIGADINVIEAWQQFVIGNDVVVGILDDACDVAHEDLAGNYTSLSHSAATGQRNQTAANPLAAGQRHGTSIMGLICAELNEIGIIGVAPRARFTASAGADAGLSASQIAGAFDFAADRFVDVHCDSWSGDAGAPVSSTVVSALDDVFQDGRDGFGMVVVFPSGNDGVEAAEGSSLAAARNSAGQKLVIGVGACNARERVTSYSNFGAGVDVVAPSNDVFLPQLVTTDNTDGAGLGDAGYNSNGVDDFGQTNLSDPQYTQGDSFSSADDPDAFGTSAAAAQVAGVAALVLSVSESLGRPSPTATQVRAMIEHTSDQIPLASPEEGDYNVVTGRSRRYGYGRVNAGAAVESALLMTSNSPFTWPERVKNVEVDARSDTLIWETNDDVRTIDGDTVGDETTAVLVVQRVGQDFEWAPEDGETYFAGQIVDVLQDVRVVQNSAVDEFSFDDSRGVVYFGTFSRNAAGRYSFGVSINSLGVIVETGRISGGGGGNVNDNIDDGTPDPDAPTVAIQVFPLSGLSPLTVSFRGNAPESDSAITSMVWDFGDDSPPSNNPVAEHTYTLPGTTTQTYVATFSVTDADGDVGRRSVLITVFSSEDPGDGGSGDGSVRIVIKESGQTADLGDSAPLGELLELSVDTSRIIGTPQSVFWSLGDGSTRNSFVVLHTYEIAGTFPISVAVTSQTSSGDNVVFPASRLLTIVGAPTDNANTNGNDNTGGGGGGGSGGGGGGGILCGLGLIVPMLAMVALALLRRFRFV